MTKETIPDSDDMPGPLSDPLEKGGTLTTDGPLGEKLFTADTVLPALDRARREQEASIPPSTPLKPLSAPPLPDDPKTLVIHEGKQTFVIQPTAVSHQEKKSKPSPPWWKKFIP